MKSVRNILFLLSLVVVVACGGNKRSEQIVREAAAFIKDKPDSAYTLLNEILFPEELPAKERAEYARLYAKAANGAGKSFQADTLLLEAAGYYLSAGDSLSAHECYLYEGGRLQKMEKADEAIKYMELSLSLLPDSLKSSRDAINHEMFQTAISPTSFNTAKQYARRLLASDDSLYVALGYYDLGCAYYWQNAACKDKAVEDSSFVYTEKAVAIAERNNVQLLPHYLRNSVNFRLPKTEILRRLHKVIALEGESSNICADLAYCHLYYRETDSARYYLDRADSLYRKHWSASGLEYVTMKNQLTSLRTVLNLMQGKKDFFVFPGPFNDSIFWAGQRYRESQAEAIVNIGKSSKRELLHAERRHNQTLAILCLVFLLLAGTAGAFLYINAKRRKWAEMQEKAETLERMVEESNRQGSDSGMFKKVLLQQLGVIKLIASTPTETNKNLLKSISRLQWEGKDFDGVLNWSDIYALIDSVFDRFHARLVERFGNQLNEKEIQLICLLKADFSTKEISVLVEQSTRTIYQRKSEIRRKLNLDEAADIASELTGILLF